MKISADELRKIAEFPAEAIGKVLLLLADRAEQEDARREKDVARKREKCGKSGGKSADPSPPSFPPHTPPITPPSPLKAKNPNAGAREALELVLDAERAEAVVAHRRALRKPLTAHAAGLLARQFSLCDDPNAGADAMIANGWQGFKPEWLERQNGNGSGRGPPRRSPLGEMVDDLLRETREKHGNASSKFEH